MPQSLAGRQGNGELATSDAALRQVLFGLPGVPGIDARVESLATRSIGRVRPPAADGQP
jgi:hypothetical protein